MSDDDDKSSVSEEGEEEGEELGICDIGDDYDHDFMANIMAQTENHNVDTCTVDECAVCGYIVCPEHYIEHFWHDGCPNPACNES